VTELQAAQRTSACPSSVALPEACCARCSAIALRSRPCASARKACGASGQRKRMSYAPAATPVSSQSWLNTVVIHSLHLLSKHLPEQMRSSGARGVLQPWTYHLHLLQATRHRTTLYAGCLAEGRQDPADAGLLASCSGRDMFGSLVR